MADFEKQRKDVVGTLERMGYIKDPRVKRAMLKVKREDFVAPEYRENAYLDTPLPIPGDVTISAPHMHAIFMAALKLKPGDRVLEVGFGSGILLAYMREVVGEKGKVIGIDIVPEAYKFGKKNLERAGYKDIKVVLSDGSLGLPEEAPFDKIISSASCPKVPKPWIEQLKLGGIIVSPVGPGGGQQELIYIEKTKEGKIVKKNLGGVVFVELKGLHGFR
jgi:protein-L-isoaspartate(D-aspartate) O-methyltransferase